MSIAVATVVKPSRHFAVLMGGFCLGVASIGGLLAFGVALDLPPALRAALALILTVIPLWAIRTINWRGKSLRIDISEHGQIMVAEDKTCPHEGQLTGSEKAIREQDAGSAVVKLLPDSTIWPHFLLLRLRDENHRIRNVLILRDCMSIEDFRALSVACRWIAAHNG